MPVAPTYPGVYIEEIPSGVRTITGVATSITAFLGRARRGPTNEPIRIQSFADFERNFGEMHVDYLLGYALQHFFANGGTDAIVIRIVNTSETTGATIAKITLQTPAGTDALHITAHGAGAWGNKLRVRVDYNTRPANSTEKPDDLFNLFVKDIETGTVESYRNVSLKTDHPRQLDVILANESQLVRGEIVAPDRPQEHAKIDPNDANPNPDMFSEKHPTRYSAPTGANVGKDETAAPNQATDVLGNRDKKSGLYALEKVDLFNLLCIPPLSRDFGHEVADATYAAAAKYCRDRRAMLLVDAPSKWNSIAAAEDGIGRDIRDLLGDDIKNAAIFFPRLKMADPLQENRTSEFVPCGAVAGVMARTDAQRGVWKAPAGIEAALSGVREFSVKMTDPENGRLNPLGINCLRKFPVYGNLVWGARTLAGADQLTSEWKYIPVRRLALFLEESLYRGTHWVVFEPNDEPLWAQIRLNVGAFMQGLFRKGAFQGRSSRDAYFVRCDSSTTTQNDINLGIVNIEVGFAPLKPAEFVIIKIQQIAGKIET